MNYDEVLYWGQGMKSNILVSPINLVTPVVLVIDDCPNTCIAIQRDLKAIGCHGVTATTVLEAVKWLEHPQFRPQTAIIDLFLGPISGLDILDYLTEDHPDIYRVLISGCVQTWQLKLALTNHRAHNIMTKPWNRSRLADVIGV